VITAHGGDARTVRDRYLSLTSTEQQYIIAYLSTLVIDPRSVTDDDQMAQITGQLNERQVSAQ
jgi:hypothetical protein